MNYFTVKNEDKLKSKNNLKNEDNFKNEDELKFEDNLKNEDGIKTKDDLKNDDDLKNEYNLIWKTVPSARLHNLNCPCFLIPPVVFVYIFQFSPMASIVTLILIF